MRQIILDTETTGLRTEDGHKIIEIGCVELINRKLTGKHYHQYINPMREMEEGALAVHGITQQFLQDKPLFADIVEEFLAFIQGAELIIHNAPFDVGFVNYELGLINHKWRSLAKHCRIVDSLVIARQLHIGQKNSLDALCKRYMVDNSQRELHGALLDAHLLAQVYLAMTGGQASLFDDMRPMETQAENKAEAIVVQRKVRKLKVIRASEAEVAEHEKYFEKT